jgi:hypothetical protein
VGGARGGRKSRRVSAKAKDALAKARSAKGRRGKKALMAPPATSASATDVSRELEASPGADQSAEFGMGVS